MAKENNLLQNCMEKIIKIKKNLYFWLFLCVFAQNSLDLGLFLCSYAVIQNNIMSNSKYIRTRDAHKKAPTCHRPVLPKS